MLTIPMQVLDQTREAYLQDANPGDWRATPIRKSMLAQFPPSLIIVPGEDPLRDEGIDLHHTLFGERCTR